MGAMPFNTPTNIEPRSVIAVAFFIKIPIVAPIALNGFYTYNGMTFTQLMKKKLYFAFMNRPLTYISTEGEDEIRRIFVE